MAQKRQVPKATSTLTFEKYTPSAPVLSSVDAGWQNLIVRTYVEPQFLDHLVVPATPDPHVVLLLSGTTHIELKDNGDWTSIHARAGDLFFTAADGQPYEMRWVSESDERIETLHLHLNAQLLAQIGKQAAGIDSSRIELLECSAVRDPVIEQICLTLKRELEQGGVGGKLYADSANKRKIPSEMNLLPVLC